VDEKYMTADAVQTLALAVTLSPDRYARRGGGGI